LKKFSKKGLTAFAQYDIIITEREVNKMMTREQMIDNVIRKFGFEVKVTIDFCWLCEREVNDDVVINRYNELMN